MTSPLVGSTDCILLVKDIPSSFTEFNLLSRCESIENAIHLREHAEIKNHLVAERGFQSLLCVERNDS